MKPNYALACVDLETSKIFHVCFYNDPPASVDRASLIEDLKTNEEFDQTDLVYGKDYMILECTDHTTKEILKTLKSLKTDFRQKVYYESPEI